MKSSKQYYSLLSLPASPCSVCFLISLSRSLCLVPFSSSSSYSPSPPVSLFTHSSSSSSQLVPPCQFRLRTWYVSLKIWASHCFYSSFMWAANKCALFRIRLPHFIIYENAAVKRIAWPALPPTLFCRTRAPCRQMLREGVRANRPSLDGEHALTQRFHAWAVPVTANVIIAADIYLV